MSNFRDTQPFLMNGGKIDPLSEIRNVGITTNGSVFWVKKVADSDYTTFQDQVGAANVRNTWQDAVDLARSDTNDYILGAPIVGYGTWTLGTALDLNEDRLHVIALGYSRSPYGYAAQLQGFATSTGIDTELIAVTGNGVELAGFRALGTSGTVGAGTMSNGLLYVNADEFTARDSTFEINQDIWGSPSVLLVAGTKHGARFDNCDFVVAGTGNLEGAGNAGVINLGHGGKRQKFSDCKFVIQNAGSTTESFVTAGTGAKEYVLFERCDFLNLSATHAQTSAVRGSTTVGNPVIMKYCTALNTTAFGTDPTVYASPNQAGTAGAGIHNPGILLRGSSGIVAA